MVVVVVVEVVAISVTKFSNYGDGEGVDSGVSSQWFGGGGGGEGSGVMRLAGWRGGRDAYRKLCGAVKPRFTTTRLMFSLKSFGSVSIGAEEPSRRAEGIVRLKKCYPVCVSASFYLHLERSFYPFTCVGINETKGNVP